MPKGELLDDWLTAGEITERFGIGKAAVRMAVKRGSIPPADQIDKGGVRLIRRTTAERLWGKKE